MLHLTPTLVLVFVLATGLVACGGKGERGGDGGVDAHASDAGADAGDQAVSLSLGELYDVSGDGSGVLEEDLATPTGEEEFLVMVQSLAVAVNRMEPFFVAVTPGTMARRAPVLSPPSVGALPWPRPRVVLPASRPWAVPTLDLFAPGRSRGGVSPAVLTDLRERLRGQPVPRGVLPPPSPAPPPVEGDTLSFQIGGAGGVSTVDASVILVSESLLVCLDKTTDPNLEMDPALLEEVAMGFEGIALPRIRAFFGQESDVNGDGRVTLLFSPIVAETATAYVNPYDLVTDPELRPPGVAANDQEILYVAPPQLLPPHMGTARAILETLAHELQHAIYFYRKYILNSQLYGVESVYITEGLSGLAQDLSGYQAGLFFIGKTALDQWDLISINDLARSSGNYFMDRSELYGGAYLLLRYLFDQAGGEVLLPDGMVDEAASPGLAWLRALVDSPHLGEASLQEASAQGVTELATDFFTALMVDDRLDQADELLNPDPRYHFLSPTVDPLTGRQRGTTMFEVFMGAVTKTGPIVRDVADADGGIRAGGSEYLWVVASVPGSLNLRVTADPVRVDPLVRVFRVR